MNRPATLLPALMCLALSSPVQAASPRSGVPRLDIRTTCNSRGATEIATTEACMRDENGAKAELATMWSKVPGDVRRTCLDEVKIGGSASYVELLTCSQMNAWSRTPPGAAGATGAASGPARR